MITILCIPWRPPTQWRMAVWQRRGRLQIFLNMLLKETAKECSSDEEATHSAEPYRERQKLCYVLKYLIIVLVLTIIINDRRVIYVYAQDRQDLDQLLSVPTWLDFSNIPYINILQLFFGSVFVFWYNLCAFNSVLLMSYGQCHKYICTMRVYVLWKWSAQLEREATHLSVNRSSKWYSWRYAHMCIPIIATTSDSDSGNATHSQATTVWNNQKKILIQCDRSATTLNPVLPSLWLGLSSLLMYKYYTMS